MYFAYNIWRNLVSFLIEYQKHHSKKMTEVFRLLLPLDCTCMAAVDPDKHACLCNIRRERFGFKTLPNSILRSGSPNIKPALNTYKMQVFSIEYHPPERETRENRARYGKMVYRTGTKYAWYDSDSDSEEVYTSEMWFYQIIPRSISTTYRARLKSGSVISAPRTVARKGLYHSGIIHPPFGAW